MLLARWSIEARFGYKQTVIDLLNTWLVQIGGPAGVKREQARLLDGSIGVSESMIQSELTVKDMTELYAIWEKMSAMPAHHEWAKNLEQFIVSGSNRWEIFHIV